jgi:hypothetical protein
MNVRECYNLSNECFKITKCVLEKHEALRSCAAGLRETCDQFLKVDIDTVILQNILRPK